MNQIANSQLSRTGHRGYTRVCPLWEILRRLQVSHTAKE